ncbi:MAG TPA: hypothetical protein VJ417_11875, partial [Candidatus Glassbacteria bacterium]|nr:hypothetical protein [Candidatus Glassbacteria bacterium]
ERGVSLTLKGQEGARQIAELMESFRKDRPAEVSGSSLAGYWDLLSNQRVNLAAGGTEETDLPESNVLMYFLADGSKVSLRPSGTEPKIKFYFSVKSKVEAGGALADAKKAGDGRIAGLQEDFMKLVDSRLAAL